METPVQENLGAVVTLHFLADEGQIRASAEVRHTKPGQGVGLKFIASKWPGLPAPRGSNKALCS